VAGAEAEGSEGLDGQEVPETVEAWRFAELRGRQAAVLFSALDDLAGSQLEHLGQERRGQEGRGTPAGSSWGPDALGDHERYALWILEREAALGSQRPGSGARVTAESGPRISVVVPLYRPDLGLLRRALGSVEAQTYPNWEICCCDDGSGSAELLAVLEELQGRHRTRFRWTALERNQGISAATNAALALAGGSWVAFMDQDDELAPEALEAVAAAILEDPEVDLVYTDDDKIDVVGRRFGPQFKPDWSPDLLLSMCYFSHLVVARRQLVDEVGGLRSAFDGSQDFDLWLRVTERARGIRHIPRVLYHWRAIPGSAALDSQAKPWAYEAGRRAIEDALDRRGEEAQVIPNRRFPGIYRVRWAVRGEPLVSVIVPFRDRAALLQRCLDRTLGAAGHDPLELVLVDNGSSEPETLALLESLQGDPRVRVVPDPAPFNWSRLVNRGVAASRGEYLLFLNNDIVEGSQGWLTEMLGQAQRPSVGAVGARLSFPDGRLQHVGMVLGVNGLAGHVLRGLPADQPGYLGYGIAVRNWTAVTGACLLTPRPVFEEVGGLDESLEVGFNDVDYCLRLGRRGYRVVATPDARLVHAESSSRGLGGAEEDLLRFAQRWGDAVLRTDPLYHPYLSRFDLSYVLARPEEEEQWTRLLRRLEQPSSSTDGDGTGRVGAGSPGPSPDRPLGSPSP